MPEQTQKSALKGCQIQIIRRSLQIFDSSVLIDCRWRKQCFDSIASKFKKSRICGLGDKAG